MIHSFKLNDFDELLDEYEEEHGESMFGSLKELFVTSDEDSELYAYGMRIVIPEYHISIREGLIYDKEDESNCIEALIVYDENEKDPVKYNYVASNTELTFLAHSYATADSDGNPEAYYDEDELIYWD